MNSIMIGTCPNCGKQISRPAPCSHAVCNCHNPPTLVPLTSDVNGKEVPKPTLVVLKPKGVNHRMSNPGNNHCPYCAHVMIYKGSGWFECMNEKCSVIEVHVQRFTDDTFAVKIDRVKRAAR